MNFQLLVSDLDGTLLGKEGHITDKTAEALNKAQKAGLRLIVATGRSWKTASPLIEQANILCDYYILLNGAECRTGTGDLVKAISLPLQAARRVVAILRRYNVGYEINTDLGDFTTNTDLCTTAEPISRIFSLWSAEPQVSKIFAFSNDAAALKHAGEELRSQSSIAITASAPWNLEITAKEAQKGKMALWVAKHLGIALNNILVFGDSDNDMSLFQTFTHTCAMGNAVGSIQEVAEKVIESNAKDGVALEIERVLVQKFPYQEI